MFYATVAEEYSTYTTDASIMVGGHPQEPRENPSTIKVDGRPSHVHQELDLNPQRLAVWRAIG